MGRNDIEKNACLVDANGNVIPLESLFNQLITNLTTMNAGIIVIDENVDDIEAVTENIPDNGAMTSIAQAINLAAVQTIVDDTALKVTEIEKHFHTREKWFGVASPQVGETHIASRMAGTINPFALLSDNDDFGLWIQLMGSTDTPVEAGKTRMDAHRILVTTTDSTNPFLIQIVAGESADIAAKILAEQFTEFPFISQSNNNDSGISEVKTLRVPSGTKIWARVVCIGADAKTINFYYGIHEYLV